MKIGNLTLQGAGGSGDFNSIAIELEGQLRWKPVSAWSPESRVETHYIVNIVDKSLHGVPTGVVANELDEFTPGRSCRSTSIREAGVRLLNVHERRRQHLVS